VSYSAMVWLVNSRELREEEEDKEAPCRVLLGRFGRPKDVAELAVLLVAVGWLTGQVVALDSGVSCHHL
jgi:NAD(P)-dependent dehydrogenase (short-subunit alcohol dehydrogenase family)